MNTTRVVAADMARRYTCAAPFSTGRGGGPTVVEHRLCDELGLVRVELAHFLVQKLVSNRRLDLGVVAEPVQHLDVLQPRKEVP